VRASSNQFGDETCRLRLHSREHRQASQRAGREAEFDVWLWLGLDRQRWRVRDEPSPALNLLDALTPYAAVEDGIHAKRGEGIVALG
jgi:hypothetical protein